MEADSDSQAPDRTSRPLAILLTVLMAGQILLIWLPDYLPTNDGPAHLYSAWVSRQLSDNPKGPLSAWFYKNPRTIYPNAAYAEFLEASARFIPIASAERIALSLYFVALPLAVGFFARSIGREPLLPAFFAAALSFNWLFFLGFFNFLWGVPATFALFGLQHRVLRRPTVVGVVAANLLLALLFWIHLVVFAAALLGAAIMALIARRPWLGMAMAAPVTALSPLFWPRSVGLERAWRWKDTLGERALDSVGLNVATAFGGAERALALGLGICVMAAAVIGLLRVRKGRLIVIALSGAFLLAAVVGPDAIGSGSVLVPRWMLFGWLCLGCALDLGRGRQRFVAAVVLALAIAAHAAFLAVQFRRFDRQMSDFMAGTEVIPKGARVFSLTQVPKARPFLVRPMATAHSYYYLALDSPNFSHYEAAKESAPHFPVGYKKEAMRYFLGEKRLEDLHILDLCDWADYLVLWQAIPRQLDRLLTRGGYRILMKRGELTVLVHERVAGMPAS